MHVFTVGGTRFYIYLGKYGKYTEYTEYTGDKYSLKTRY